MSAAAITAAVISAAAENEYYKDENPQTTVVSASAAITKAAHTATSFFNYFKTGLSRLCTEAASRSTAANRYRRTARRGT